MIYNILFTPADLDMVAEALGAQPFRQVATLLSSIANQKNQQDTIEADHRERASAALAAAEQAAAAAQGDQHGSN